MLFVEKNTRLKYEPIDTIFGPLNQGDTKLSLSLQSEWFFFTILHWQRHKIKFRKRIHREITFSILSFSLCAVLHITLFSYKRQGNHSLYRKHTNPNFSFLAFCEHIVGLIKNVYTPWFPGFILSCGKSGDCHRK